MRSSSPQTAMVAETKSKYDRQLRIWGDQGQIALEKASLCLLNCGPTGSETLKNLVLGGIGSITVIDGSRVEAGDLGNNFMVDQESVGISRAKCVCSFLQELNDAVKVKFIEEVPETFIETKSSFFAQFTLVIATQLVENSLLKLEKICRQANVMFLVARSYGLVGLVRISLKEHNVIDSKPDHFLDDLRLHYPWPELKQFADSIDINTVDPVVHKHTPYIIILIKIAEKWSNEHGGKLPSTREEEKDFKELLKSQMIDFDEENYKEGVDASFKVFARRGIRNNHRQETRVTFKIKGMRQNTCTIVLGELNISFCSYNYQAKYLHRCIGRVEHQLLRLQLSGSHLQQIINDSSCELDSSTPDFWVLVSALKEFVANEGHGEPPLEGSIPDMTSLTEYYVNLQRLYQAKAEADCLVIENYVRKLLKSIGRDTDAISKSYIKNFCKNARKLTVCRYRTIAEEFKCPTQSELQKYLADEDYSYAVGFYILLRAVDRFSAIYNRFPGLFDGELDEDLCRLKAIAINMLNEVGCNGSIFSEDLISEMCRFGGAEPHAVAAIIGGIASQEAIKLITKQFVPMIGTFIFNGIDHKSQLLVL